MLAEPRCRSNGSMFSLIEQIAEYVLCALAGNGVRRDQHGQAPKPSGRIFEQVNDVTAVTCVSVGDRRTMS